MLLCPLDLIYVHVDPLESWPVTWGMPLPAGQAADAAALRLRGPDGALLPAQMRVLARHPDGSIHRLLVTAEPAVAPDSQATFDLVAESAGAAHPAPQPPRPARAEADALHGAAGTLRLADDRLWLETHEATYELSLHAAGRPAGGADPAAPLPPLAWRWRSLTAFETGPIQAAAVVLADSELLTVRITVRMPAATPAIFLDVYAVNLSDHDPVDIQPFELRLERQGEPWRQVTHEVRQVPQQQTAPLPVRLRAGKLAIEIHHGQEQRRYESRLLNYNETWLALDTGGGQTLVGARNFFETFPYGIDAQPRRLTFAFWPAWADRPWSLAQGRGKTHEIAMAFPSSGSGLTGQAFGYAFGKPPMARVPLAVQQAAGSLTGLAAWDPDRYPRLETTLYDLTYNRNRGYGKMHWGDDYSVLYTNQLRGKGEVVWNNLEGDHPFHMFCQFVRTGRFLYHKEFHDSLLHWADVDFCDRHRDPLKEGALTVHSAGHTCGAASPCHNWAESFREWYFATGDPRPHGILTQMADWLVRQHERGFFRTEPEPYVRGCGWGLIQMAAIQQVLARPDLEAILRDLCRRLLDYCRAHGGLTMTLPTGGHRLPRDNAFHTATVVLGAWRCWEIYRDPLMRELALAAAEAFMDRRTCTPEGLAVYITGPEQDFPMQQAAGLTLAGLAAAYQLSGEERFVRRGMRMLEYCLDRGMIVDHMRIPGEFLAFGDDVVLNVPLLMPNSQLLGYQLRGLLLFMQAAHRADLLKAVDYQF